MRGRGVTATREHSLARDALLVVAAAGITAIAAQISFGYPVPTTLQTFAVFSTAAVLGARLGSPPSSCTSPPARSACPCSPMAWAASTA